MKVEKTGFSVTGFLFSFVLLGEITLFFPSFTQAQSQGLRFSLDHAQFRMQQNYLYLEVYYATDRKGLTFVKEGKKWVARINIKTSIFKGDSLVVGDDINVEDWVTSLDEVLPGQKLVELSAFQIRGGDYRLRAVLTDLNSSRSLWHSEDLHLRPYSNRALEISEVQLASSISRINKNVSKFDKNFFRIIPNPSGIYGMGLSFLYFYAEAYNLAYGGEATGSTFQIRCTVSDTSGAPVIGLKKRSYTKPGSSVVIEDKVRVDSLNTGRYTLKIELTDDFNGKRAVAEKPFFVYNARELFSLEKGSTALVTSTGSEYDQMDENKINEAFNQLRYISTRHEKEIFKKLDLKGKRSFMVTFWKRRDPTPNTTVNEYKRKYLQLLHYANENFSVGSTEGWQTDRGRVLLLYGMPDQIDRFPSSSDRNAYQIWYYYQIEGGVEFIFVDYTDVGDYKLVHSTKKDELQNENWQRYLYR